jgi:PilZ domain
MEFKRRGERRERRGRPRGDRRRTIRQAAGWSSRYMVVDADQLWFGAFDKDPCVLRDLSVAGAGLEFSDREVSVGDRVVLDLQLGNRQRASIQLTGEVRHATTDDQGIVTAGLEFVDIGDLERALLLRLLRDMEVPARQTG